MTRAATPSRAPVREMRSDAVRNREELLRAATVAFHREGLNVPMAAIAAEAGVGIGTLYRHFPDRDTLLIELTHRSFEQVLANAVTAEAQGSSPLDSLRRFADAAIGQRDQLVLPLHGGPGISRPATRRAQVKIHDIIGRIVDQGKADGEIRAEVDPSDVMIFGAMLSQPRKRSAPSDAVCRRLLDSFLRGLRP